MKTSFFKRTRARYILSGILALLAFGLLQFYSLYFANPFKVINPDNPLFVPSWFEAKDYRGRPDLWDKAVKRVMPQGTDISVIRKLMKRDSTCLHEVRDKPYYGFVHFVCTTSLKYPGGINMIYLFDSNDKLIDYFGSGQRGVYTGKFPEEIREEMKND